LIALHTIQAMADMLSTESAQFGDESSFRRQSPALVVAIASVNCDDPMLARNVDRPSPQRS
jgi:hypothetical protein